VLDWPDFCCVCGPVAWQTLGQSLIALGGWAFYDRKHKKLLNSVLLGFHLLCTASMLWHGTYKQTQFFALSPMWFHLPMLLLHGAAVGSNVNPSELTAGSKQH
jgi:hypothetical protein